MTSKEKEALEIIKNIDCTNFGLTYDEEPISNTFAKEFQIIENGLETLNIFKKNLFIEIANRPKSDGTYMITITTRDNDNSWKYLYLNLWVSEEEKNIIREWLKR